MRLILSAAILLTVAPPASAHRLDEYLQATRVSLSPNRVVLEIDLTPGTAVAPQVLPMIDIDGNGQVSDAEAQSYAERVMADLRLEVDGQRRILTLIRVEASSVRELTDGLGSVRLTVEAAGTAAAAGRRSLWFQNDHQPALSAYLVNALVPSSARIDITGQQRDVRQQGIRLDYDISSDRNEFASLWWLVAGIAFLGAVRHRCRRAQA